MLKHNLWHLFIYCGLCIAVQLIVFGVNLSQFTSYYFFFFCTYQQQSVETLNDVPNLNAVVNNNNNNKTAQTHTKNQTKTSLNGIFK